MAIVGIALGSAVRDDVKSSSPVAPIASSLPIATPVAEEPKYEELAIGQTLEWRADASPDDLVRQAGPMVVRVSKKLEDDLAAPLLRISAGNEEITLEGAMTQPGYSHKISLITNREGAAPVIMLQSFTGGAHCCNSIQLAGFSKGKLTKVDLGNWDGDSIAPPTDINGDGVLDFVLSDNRFLYSFSSYAASYSPPQIFNVVGGKVVDVSSRKGYRGLFSEMMRRAEELCVSGESGDERNGACPGYVAAAARLGLLEQAWPKMIQGYDASETNFLPSGCRVKTENACPEGQQFSFKSYPEALLNFLQEAGYISKGWVAPEFRSNIDPDDVAALGADDASPM